MSFTVQRVAPSFDEYRSAIWIAPTDGSEPARGLTIGALHDTHARWSPDGRSLAFLSDRRTVAEEEPAAPKDREDQRQVHLLPIDRPGEARRLTDLPRGVDQFAWSPDGRQLALLSVSRSPTREADSRARGKLREAEPGQAPPSDYRFTDRLHYQENGPGWTANRVPQLWLFDVETHDARRLTDFDSGVTGLAWSPDGSRIAITTGPARDHDLWWRWRVLCVDAQSGAATAIAQDPSSVFFTPAWLPDGRTIAVLGGSVPHLSYRFDIRLFPADVSDPRGGRDLSSRHDVMPASAVNSDLTISEPPRLVASPDGRSILFLAPHRGAQELHRISTADGVLERLTDGRQYLSSFDAVGLPGGGIRVATIRSAPIDLPDVHVGDLGVAAGSMAMRRVSDLNRGLLEQVELREPTERWVTVDGREVQGWLIAAGDGPRPTVLEIHGGPHTLYGWTPFWEFQVLAGAGISVAYANPRGSEGYGRDFNEANLRDWGDGPMRDVLGLVDALVADGRADPERLGVTGGSYGGYLTNWIVGHDDRFRAAFTARSVSDMTMLMLTGDLTGTDWPEYEFGAYPWDDPELYRRISPITYVDRIRTPLLIQHAERDIRTTLGQAEALFAALRRRRRPVRLMRVPDDTHELTRSGAPFRRVENLSQVRDWFRHFLVDGKRRLPPLPATRHGR